MEEEQIIYRWKNGHIIPIKVKPNKTTNQYMNDKIKSSATTIEGSQSIYTKYDDDETSFKNNNPNIVLQQTNQIINEWTSDGGGYHSNSGIMKYMTEDRDLYGVHQGWEQGVRDIDNQITGSTSENIITYRTVQIPVKKLNIGDSVDEKGFVATSISRSESVKRFNRGDAYSSTIEVEVDKGTRCLYIGDKTGHISNKTGKPESEYELLFPEEYKIIITDKQIEYDSDGDYSRTIFKGKMAKK